MINSFKTQQELRVGEINYHYFSLPLAEQAGLKDISKLPFSLKILLENLLRHEDGISVTTADIQALATWLQHRTSTHEIAYRPARVLMQDFTGVPAIVDLAAMRAAMEKMQAKPAAINPLSSVDLVIDHSIQVDAYGSADSLNINSQLEMQRNRERYEFLRWGQKAFANFRVVPPDTGICHQVNLEFLAKTIWSEEKNGLQHAYPDTLVGTDSHTTMINGLGVLGWGVGGIEAEAAMLGQPISMLIPEVIGVKLTGRMREGITATDLVLTLTQILRQKGVVGRFVEYFGAGLEQLSVADRATLANMAPEYGATCGFFPIDQQTLAYLHLTGREKKTLELVEAYAKIQGLWRDASTADPLFTDTVELDLSSVEPSLAGPKRPQDRVALSQLKLAAELALAETSAGAEKEQAFATTAGYDLHHGDVVLAAITSCTNTSNPNVLIAAGLVAKKALEKGLRTKPWVKTSLAPGSQVVTRYLTQSGLQPYLDALGFSLVGYGCTTCIGNSGPLPEATAETIVKNNLNVAAVLSGNRNFEGRIHPLIKANWLASPPLVVLFALTGTTRIDLTQDVIGCDRQGKAIYLKDLWPTKVEIAQEVAKIHRSLFKAQYADVFTGSSEWQTLKSPTGETYEWQKDSTYIQHPPYFKHLNKTTGSITEIHGARILALFGDSITTDHISPAGSIKADSPAGRYLLAEGVAVKDFNSYGARRGNHEVMMRGTFANIRIKNEMLENVEGGYTKHFPSNEVLPIYDAAMLYQQELRPLLIVAGKEYGTGSSRDWAAKGPMLQGVKVVIAESFERIHRSNLIGMGILPVEFMPGMTRKTLKLRGDELIDILELHDQIKPRSAVKARIHYSDGSKKEITLLSRIDTLNELEYYRQGGILQYVLKERLSITT